MRERTAPARALCALALANPTALSVRHWRSSRAHYQLTTPAVCICAFRRRTGRGRHRDRARAWPQRRKPLPAPQAQQDPLQRRSLRLRRACAPLSPPFQLDTADPAHLVPTRGLLSLSLPVSRRRSVALRLLKSALVGAGVSGLIDRHDLPSFPLSLSRRIIPSVDATERPRAAIRVPRLLGRLRGAADEYEVRGGARSCLCDSGPTHGLARAGPSLPFGVILRGASSAPLSPVLLAES